MLIIFPLSSVNCSIGILVDSIAVHLVFEPGSFVGLEPDVLVGCRDSNDSLAVFHFVCLDDFPGSLINGAIKVLKLAKALKLVGWNFDGLFFFGGLFFFRIFFGCHIYNLFKFEMKIRPK